MTGSGATVAPPWDAVQCPACQGQECLTCEFQGQVCPCCGGVLRTAQGGPQYGEVTWPECNDCDWRGQP